MQVPSRQRRDENWPPWPIFSGGGAEIFGEFQFRNVSGAVAKQSGQCRGASAFYTVIYTASTNHELPCSAEGTLHSFPLVRGRRCMEIGRWRRCYDKSQRLPWEPSKVRRGALCPRWVGKEIVAFRFLTIERGGSANACIPISGTLNYPRGGKRRQLSPFSFPDLDCSIRPLDRAVF